MSAYGGRVTVRPIARGRHAVALDGEPLAVVVRTGADPRHGERAGWRVRTVEPTGGPCPISRAEVFGTLRAALEEIMRTTTADDEATT